MVIIFIALIEYLIISPSIYLSNFNEKDMVLTFAKYYCVLINLGVWAKLVISGLVLWLQRWIFLKKMYSYCGWIKKRRLLLFSWTSASFISMCNGQNVPGVLSGCLPIWKISEKKRGLLHTFLLFLFLVTENCMVFGAGLIENKRNFLLTIHSNFVSCKVSFSYFLNLLSSQCYISVLGRGIILARKLAPTI